MFIEQGVRPENPYWKYLLGSVIVIVASFIGQVPLGIAIVVKAMSGGGPIPSDTAGVMKYLSGNEMLFWMLLSFAFGLAALFVVVRYIHNQSWLSMTTSRKKFDWRRTFFAFFLWTLISVGLTAADYFMSPGDYVWNFDAPRFLVLLPIAILMIPIQTSCEEYVFRGYLMQGFGRLAYNKWFPLIMTSLIFGLMHIANPEVDKIGYGVMLYYVGTGMLLGVMTLMDEGMELSLGFHAANNVIGALLVTTEWSALQTDSILKDVSDPSTGADILAPVFIVYPLLLFIFSKTYRWTGWKERLTGQIPRDNGAYQPEL